MGTIYCLIGKSGTGKDTVLEAILNNSSVSVEKIVPYTTRPKREGEIDGINYRYVSVDELAEMEKGGKVIERRSYNTVKGEWNYFTAACGIDDNKDYIIITTQEAIPHFFRYFGENRIHVLYLKLDNKIRLERCINRESMQNEPNYSEVCRRYLADEQDFDEEKIMSYLRKTIVDTAGELNEYAEYIAEIIKSQQHF